MSWTNIYIKHFFGTAAWLVLLMMMQTEMYVMQPSKSWSLFSPSMYGCVRRYKDLLNSLVMNQRSLFYRTERYDTQLIMIPNRLCRSRCFCTRIYSKQQQQSSYKLPGTI